MIKVDDLITLAKAGVTAERLNAIVDAELEESKKAKDPDPEDKKDPEPEPKPEDKKDPEPEPKPEDKKDPEPDEKDQKIIDLEKKVKQLQEDNRRKSGNGDATAEFEKRTDDLISKISSDI